MVPMLGTNAPEMAAKIRALRCQLETMRAELDRAAATALDRFAGPERDAFIERHEQTRHALVALEHRLDGVPTHIEQVGSDIVNARRDAIAAAFGPAGIVANEAAQRLGW